MSILTEIETLETRVQQLLLEAGQYSSVDDFVAAYTNSILDALGDFSKIELAQLDTIGISNMVEQAIEASADLIIEDMAEQISASVDAVIDNTVAFYSEVGVQVPALRDAIARTEAAQEITQLFQTNMAGMRSELLEGTIETLQTELAQGLVNRADMEELIFQYADGKAHYARTNARMIVSSYNRIGRDQVRESAGLTHGYYYGDARVNTRPFCLRVIDKVFTMEQIEQMDNGQLSPVRIYAGGWNCIHSWLWVDPEWDEQLKSKISTDPIVPVEEEYLNLQVPG
jgi:hypothetical protein